jgi:hypothetical protein
MACSALAVSWSARASAAPELCLELLDLAGSGKPFKASVLARMLCR